MRPIEAKQYDEAFVVGDIHGMHEELENILRFWEPSRQQLVFIGDYTDRGYANDKALAKVMELNREYGAICIRGNHEDMLLNYLKSPSNYFNHYVLNGGAITLAQLLQVPESEIIKSECRKIARQVKHLHPDLLNWLSQLPYYYEFGNFICCHAGVDLSLADWEETSDYDFLWLRDRFHKAENITKRQIIFGHTPTMVLHQDYNNSTVWRHDMKWGIDGGCVYGGQLHGLVLTPYVVKAIHSVAMIEGEEHVTRNRSISGSDESSRDQASRADSDN